MPPSVLRTLALAGALAVAVALTYQLRRPALPAAPCDLNREACTAPLDGGALTLRLSPRPLPVLAPIAVEVDIGGVSADEVRVELAGVEMDMGLVQSQLRPAGGGRFVGTLSIPVCATGPMRWRADVRVAQAGRSEVRSFAFDVPGNASPAHAN